MRKITILTMLLTLFGVASFAQKALPFYMTNMTERTVPPFTQFTPLANIAEKTQRGSADQVVTPPTGLVTEDYTFQATFFVPSGSSFSATAMKKLLKIGIQGNDVYVQGMSNALPEAWIKGTLNAARDKMSFESPQLYGYQNLFFPLYFVYMEFNSESDNLPDIMTFDYNAATGEITIPQQTIFIETTNSSDEGAQSNMNGFFYQIKWTKGFTHPVSAPENLETADYVITAKDNNNNDVSGAVKVGLDGNDVYIQGLSWLLPEGWVKGTLADNKITFAHDQYIGSYKNIQDLYLNYNFEDIIFDYDATSGTMTCQNNYFGVNNDTYTFNFFANAVIKKVTEKAATPAAPTITSIEATNSGDAMNFIVPVIDTEGNGLLASKLYYEFFTDVEGTINPLTFTPTTHVKLEEDLTLIPYGFTENYDFYNGQIYLNNLYSEDWNRIGIKSIYYGGGEENESEISWYTIKPYAVTLTAKSVDSKNYYATYFEGENSRLADENTTVYTAALSENQKWLTLTEVEDKVIPAGNAVVLLSSNETIKLTYTDAEATTLANNVLQGSDESQTVDPSTYYVLSAKNGVVGFYLFAGTELGANKAYIPASVVSSEARVLTFGDVTDAIQQMEKEQVTEDAAVYDLSGRRIANRQLNKGVYINNGKKIVIK